MRRVGVSLFLLAVVITAAGAASAETTDGWNFCVWPNYIDTGKDGAYRALLALANLSGQPRQYEVRLFTPGAPPPNGVGTTVELRPWETRFLDSQALSAIGIIAIMEVATQAPGLVAGTLYTAYQGNLIVQPLLGCVQ
jgi:hypothetical protein